MIRFELVRKLAMNIDVSDIRASEILDSILEGIILGVHQDGRTIIQGFGLFIIKQMKKRSHYCHFIGKKLKLSASKIPAFRASKELKKLINSH